MFAPRPAPLLRHPVSATPTAFACANRSIPDAVGSRRLPKGLSETLTVVAKTLIVTAKISIRTQKRKPELPFSDIDIIFFFYAFSSLSISGT